MKLSRPGRSRRPAAQDGVPASAAASSFAGRRSGLRTRDRLVTAALWSLLVMGPLLGLVAIGQTGSAGSAPAAAASQDGAAIPITADSSGPAGFAARYISAWLSAGEGEEEIVRAFYPAMESLARAPGTQQAAAVTVMGATSISGGYWQVVVAADILTRSDPAAAWAPATTQCFMAGILAGDADPAPTYTASALPALVSCPPAGPTPEIGYSEELPAVEGPLVQTISELLSAYLAGTGELSRYTTSGLSLAPIDPVPYVEVTVTSLQAAAEIDWEISEVPADGTTVDLLVGVDALPGAGGLDQLDYALSLTVSGGRWELAATPGPPVLDQPEGN